jgi:hypothetical protein
MTTVCIMRGVRNTVVGRRCNCSNAVRRIGGHIMLPLVVVVVVAPRIVRILLRRRRQRHVLVAGVSF